MQIQDAVIRRLGERVGGWKVGFSPEGGIFCAPIYAARCPASPASCRPKDLHLIGIECEIGFRVNRDAGAARRSPTTATRSSRRLAAPDDRGRRFALQRFPLARPAAGARRQFLERRAGLRRRGLGLAGDGPRRIRRSAVTADGKHFAESTGLRAGDPIGLLVDFVNHVARARRRSGRHLCHHRLPYRHGRSPSAARRSAPITARSAGSRSSSRPTSRRALPDPAGDASLRPGRPRGALAGGGARRRRRRARLAIAGSAARNRSRELLLLLHRSVGLVILALMVFRALWRLAHPAPPLPAGFPRIEALAAHADHAALIPVVSRRCR